MIVFGILDDVIINLLNNKYIITKNNEIKEKLPLNLSNIKFSYDNLVVLISFKKCPLIRVKQQPHLVI